MSGPDPLKIKILIAFVAVFVVGTLGYYVLEDDWTLFESFYMTAITITTVGFGETKPLSDAGRAFTVVLIFAGLGTAALFATTLARSFVERNFKDLFEANRMTKMIEKLSGHYIVCGFGDIGSSICSALSETKIPFVVIEAEDERAEHATKRRHLVVKGKATYDTTLLQAGIRRASGLVVCLGDDSLNLHVCLAARELNPDVFIVARGYKADVEKRMLRAGANTVVNPLRLGGEQMAALIVAQCREEGREEEVLLSRSSIMGFALKVYQHFDTEPITVAQLRFKLAASAVLKLRKADGSEVPLPSDMDEVQPHEIALLLIEEEEAEYIPEEEKQREVPLFEWAEKYETGIREIDEQHQQLFELANDFVRVVNQGKGDESLSRVLDALIKYTAVHFETEEKLFARHGYEHAEEHIAEHKRLIEEVVALNENRSHVIVANVAEFLERWLKKHILEDDMRYAAFIREKLAE